MADYIQKSIKGTFNIFIFTFLATLAGYLTRMFLARTISPEEFGLFYSLFTLFMFISIFTDMGYNQSLVKYIPEFMIKKDKRRLSKLIKYVINVNLILTIIISIVVLLLSGFIADRYLHIPHLGNIMLLGILILIFNNIAGFIQTVFQAFQKTFKYGLFYFLSKSLFFLSAVTLFYLGFSRDVTLPLWAYISSCILAILLFGYSAYKLMTPRMKNKYFDKEIFYKITNFALPNMISTIAGTVIGYIDTIILTAMVSLPLVGIYNATLATILIISYLGGVVATVLFPLISELSAKKIKEIGGLINIIYKYSLIIVIPCALTMLFFSDVILRILFGETFVAGATAMSILSFGAIFLVIAQINFSILNGLGHPKKVTLISVAAAIFNTVSNIILIPYLGINGAALTTTISYLMMMAWSHIYVRKNMRIKLDKLTHILVASAIFFLALYYIKNAISMNVYMEIAITLGVALIIYSAALFALGVLKLAEINSLKNQIIKKTKTK